jgi:hypothetical protein
VRLGSCELTKLPDVTQPVCQLSLCMQIQGFSAFAFVTLLNLSAPKVQTQLKTELKLALFLHFLPSSSAEKDDSLISVSRLTWV